MSKIATLNRLVNLTNETTAVAALNDNDTKIETAFTNTLSLDGSTPNQMGADLDMNSHRILNLLAPVALTEPVRLQDVMSTVNIAFINSNFLVTPFIQTLLDDASATAARTTLGLNISSFMFTLLDDTTAAEARTTLGITGTGGGSINIGLNSLFDFGADGIGDDTVQVTAADGTAGAKFVPKGLYTTTIAPTALNGPYWGWGQIIDSGSNRRAPWFTAVKSAPAVLGNEDTIATAFNGDISKTLIQAECRTSGANTLGAPLTGYKWTPEAYPMRLFVLHESGHNESTTADDGRTAMAGFYTNLYHNGRGDAMAYVARVFVIGNEASATNWAADPSGGAFHCSVNAGASFVNLNPFECALDDQAHDTSGFGYVVNLLRSVGTGGRNQWWAAFRAQSGGTQDADVAFSATGKFKYGLDLVHSTFPNQAAISLKANQRIYGNATADLTGQSRFPGTTGAEYITYDSGGGVWAIVKNSIAALQVSDLQVTATVGLKSAHSTGGIGYSAGAGGTVTQLTNKFTGVTLNRATGQITMSNAALAAGALAVFTVSNTASAVGDVVIAQLVGGAADAAAYTIDVANVGANAFTIIVKNISGGSLSEAIVLGFAIIKGVTS